jgi:hypothetical protein
VNAPPPRRTAVKSGPHRHAKAIFSLDVKAKLEYDRRTNDGTETMTEKTSPTSTNDTSKLAAKAAWNAPTVEEIDYSLTEANTALYGGPDAGIYQS